MEFCVKIVIWMNLSLYTRISDLIPVRETFSDRLNHFLFRDLKREMFKKHSLDFIFSSLKKAGIEGLELIALADLPENKISLIKNTVQKYGLQIFSLHQSTDTFLAITLQEIERLCRIANAFSASVIVLHINALAKNIHDKIFIEKLKFLQKRYKVKFGIENVAKTPFTLAKKMYRSYDFSKILQSLDCNITFDTTHLGQAGDDICDFYLRNKEKIINIHVSDYKKSWLNKTLFLTNGTHLPLTIGELPIVEFLKILKGKNYPGVITMEINGNLSQLCESASLIKNTLIR